MISPRRRARELVLKALYQTEMIKNGGIEALNSVLADDFYMPIFEALGRDFVKDTTIPQVLAGDVEEFIFNFARRLSAAPLNSEPQAMRALAENTLEAHFKGILSEPSAKALIEEFNAKIQERYDKCLLVEAFARQLVSSVVEHGKQADSLISEYAKNWTIDRMSVIDRCILRLSVCEFFYFETIPLKATINEAVELAKKYSAEKSHEFINGILDRISKEANISKVDIKNDESIKKSAEGVQNASFGPEAK